MPATRHSFKLSSMSMRDETDEGNSFDPVYSEKYTHKDTEE